MTEDETAAWVTAGNRLRAEIGAEMAKKLAPIDVALEALFRARWELNGGDFDIEALDDELGALAVAAGFDRAGAAPRWKAAQDAEIAEAHARFAADVARIEGAHGNVASSIADAIRKLAGASEESPKSNLIGKAVIDLWKRAK